MLAGLPWPPLCVGDLEGLGKVLGWPNIKMLSRKGEASLQLGMAGGNYQVTQVIIHPLSPLTSMCHVGREGQRHAAINRTRHPASGSPWVRTSSK